MKLNKRKECLKNKNKDKIKRDKDRWEHKMKLKINTIRSAKSTEIVSWKKAVQLISLGETDQKKKKKMRIFIKIY